MDVVTQFIMCYVIARLSAAIPGVFIINYLTISIMEQKFVFGVSVRDVSVDSVVPLFDSNLIDEACAFALSLFRSINRPNLEVFVYQYSDFKDVVVFKRS